MKKLLLLAFLMFGCGIKTQPEIIIDGWWDIDYAKNFCQQSDGRCDGNMLAATIRNNFVTAFQTALPCKDVILYSGFEDPKHTDKATSKHLHDAQYTLFLEPLSPDGEAFQWSMLDQKNQHKYAAGEHDTPEQAARKVCEVARGIGGTVQ
jgi:hypothetical protein